MSTHIANIKGRVEDTYKSSPSKIVYKDNTLSINRFWGGTKNGRMIQLTIDENYIQLTSKQIEELIKILSNCFDVIKYPRK